MMPSFFGGNLAAAEAAVGYPDDAILDGLSRQLASHASRRLSRGSGGQRPGGAMRVMKPSNSANNSPRSSVIQARRRTLMTDGGACLRRNPPFLDQGYLIGPAAELSGDVFVDATARSARPVSWHPTSHLAAQQQQQQQQQQHQQQQQLLLQQRQEQQQQSQLLAQMTAQYPFPPYGEMEQLVAGLSQFPPTPAAYSGYTSPSSAFSPLSLPYSGLEANPYFSPGAWALSAGTAASSLPSPAEYPARPDPFAAPAQQASQPCAQDDVAAAWDRFVAHGFDRATSPATPDSYPAAAEQPEPKVPAEEAVPYQPLEEEEPEGEILIGLGLYDPPEKEVTDPTLESYRASVAHLLGSAYKYPEPTGKGLKLEDAWEPPEIEDDDDEDDDAEKDADGDGEQEDEQDDDES